MKRIESMIRLLQAWGRQVLTIGQMVLAVVFTCILVSCDEQSNPDIDDMLSPHDKGESVGEALQITGYEFSNDFKNMELSMRLLHDVGGYDLTDSSTVVAIPKQQVRLLPGKFADETQPVIMSVTNTSRDALLKLNLKLLVLVDLSLPQAQIDAEQEAVWEIKALFGQKNLFIAFMQDDNVSETYEATDYVIDNYFEHKDPSSVFLYRSILTKLAEFQDPKMTLGQAKYKVMVILSGGKTYEDDHPVDPMHFELQQLLADHARRLQGGMLRLYYGSFALGSQSDMDFLSMSGNTDTSNIIHFLCKDLDGIYQTSFNWQEIADDIFKDFNIELSKYKVRLENPDGKVFRGNLHQLQIGFYDKESGDLVASGTTSFSLGTIYDPIIIRDRSRLDIVIAGVLTTLFILLLMWIVLQFIEPYIRYRVFKHKYVVVYSGSKMSYNGQPVSESCYLCKSPFEAGDEIVVKCKHTTHKDCWDDNDYHCPEYGRHCKEGSHYYNSHNLFDSRNALYYLKWVLIATVAGFMAWLVFTSHKHPYSAAIIQQLSTMLSDQKAGTQGAEHYFQQYGSHLSDLPGFGQVVGFLLTLFLSALTVRRRQWLYRIAEILLRAIIASVAGVLCCLLGCVISITLHLDSDTFLIDWIPWALLSCVIMLCVTVKTRTTVRKSFLLMACIVAVLSMFMWAFIYYNSFIDYRQTLLLGFIIYSVAIAVCVARVTPSSERYFLHVEGAVKEMDIALFKWLRSDPDHIVTIGKSVDCSIQLSWDVNGHVAPIHAEIRKHISSMRLSALEEGVMIGDKPLPVGKEVWLYHGRSFTVGNTTFTYVEKDLK